MKFTLKILITAILIGSCNTPDKQQNIQEDYESLFPWDGIETPESAYEDMNVKACNTEAVLNDYRYFGKNIANKRSYNVTIECNFKESSQTVGSRYDFRFINAGKELISIGTKATQSGISFVLKNQETYKRTFKVLSGYPMYLFVNGGGNQGSSVRAKITAISEDGLIVVPILSIEQYQTKRGFNSIEKPFCEYIILP